MGTNELLVEIKILLTPVDPFLPFTTYVARLVKSVVYNISVPHCFQGGESSSFLF